MKYDGLSLPISATTYQTLLCLPRIGRKTAQSVAACLSVDVASAPEMLAALEHAKQCGVRLTIPSLGVVAASFGRAKTLLEDAERHGITCHAINAKTYPTRLLEIPDPPLLVFTKGAHAILQAPQTLALIGTRRPSEAGAIAAHRLGTKLAGLNVVVVSGLALGIDTKGHEGCVASGGKGVAVLAHGLHMVSPASNQLLASRLLESGGCLVSEYPYGEPPRKNYFVERDRLQSGLADAVILVESAEQSGSMHTVRFATLQKRIVGCVSFVNPEIPSASGNRSLIESGGATPLPSMAAVEDFCAKLWQKKGRKKQKKSKPATTKRKAQKQMELHF